MKSAKILAVAVLACVVGSACSGPEEGVEHGEMMDEHGEMMDEHGAVMEGAHDAMAMDVAAATTAGELTIRDAHAMLMPHGGAVYLAVDNAGGEDDRLVAVDTDAAAGAETHESVMDGEVMRMVARPDGFVVPAGGTVELAPSGKHVMLVEPLDVPEGAESIALRLRFERAGEIELDVPVMHAGAMEH